MRKRFLLACMTLLAVLGVKAQDFPTLSTADPNAWYYIVFSRGTVPMADQGEGELLKTETLSSGSPKQLWQIAETSEGAGTYILTSMLGNKMAWNGSKYFGSPTAGEPMTLIPTTSTVFPTGWEFQRVGATQCANLFQGGGAGRYIAEWTMGDQGNVLNFVAATSDEVTTALAAAEVAKYDLLQQKLQAAANNAATDLASANVGTDVGQYTSENISVFSNAITAAQNVLDNATTSAELIAGTAAINKASVKFLSSSNKPFQVSIPGVKEYYYAIYTPNREFRTLTNDGSGILVGTEHTDESELNETLPVDQQWIITQLTDGTYAIVNPKSVNTDLTEDVYVGTQYVNDDTSLLTTTTPTTAGGWLAMNAATAPLFIIVKESPAMQFNESGQARGVLNWGYGQTDATLNSLSFILDDDGSSYNFIKVGEKAFGTGLKATTADTFRVSVNNRVITVAGADKFEVYSVDGQKQANGTALNKGVYLVKANGTVQKVVVK